MGYFGGKDDHLLEVGVESVPAGFCRGDLVVRGVWGGLRGLTGVGIGDIILGDVTWGVASGVEGEPAWAVRDVGWMCLRLGIRRDG